MIALYHGVIYNVLLAQLTQLRVVFSCLKPAAPGLLITL